MMNMRRKLVVCMMNVWHSHCWDRLSRQNFRNILCNIVRRGNMVCLLTLLIRSLECSHAAVLINIFIFLVEIRIIGILVMDAILMLPSINPSDI